MRLLFLVQGDEVADQPGYDDGFRRLKAGGLLEDYQAIPFHGFAREHGWEAFYQEAYRVAKNMEADYIFLQFFHGRNIPSPVDFISRIRTLKKHPSIFTSCGDPFGPLLHPAPKSLLDAASASDVTFSTGMGRLAWQLLRHGAKNIVLMPNGYCQVRFGEALPQVLKDPEFDIVFIGNLVWPRNPINHFLLATFLRKGFLDALTKRYGKRVAIFGRGWQGNPCWHGPVPYIDQENTCRQGRFIFGGYPNATTDYYTSDRVLIAAASGVPIVDYWVPRVDRIFKNEEHIYLFRNKKELISLFDRLLPDDDSNARQVGHAAAALCKNRHSQYHRARLMLEIMAQVRDARKKGTIAPLPYLDFFHDDVLLEDEYPYAVVNWCG